MRIRQKLIKIYDSFLLFWKNKSIYAIFFYKAYPRIVSALKKRGVNRIIPTNMHIWKLSYGTAYLKGKLNRNNTKIFVKIQGPLLHDCFNNEIVVNEYIDNNSAFLSDLKPKILDFFSIGEKDIIVYEYVALKAPQKNEDLLTVVLKVIDEFKRIGIIHTDFGLGNIGVQGNTFFFFDYGTSICPLSDNIRIRTGPEYNHIERITERAASCSSDPQYYYDDATHFGIERQDCNFLVGNQEVCFARLGDMTKKYLVFKKDAMLFISQET